MKLSEACPLLSATHQLALRCLAEGNDDLVAAERLGVPLGRLTAVVAEAGAALNRLLTEADPHPDGAPRGEMSRGLPMPGPPAPGHVSSDPSQQE